MLKRSIIGSKISMHLAIDSWVGPEDTERVVAEVLEAASDIKTLDAKTFTNHVHKLLLCNNAARAKKLVDVLDDVEPTKSGLIVTSLLILGIRLIPIVLLVLLIVWLVM
jgi:hypothetical protein